MEKQKLDVTAIIMTYNEEKNIEACLASIADFVTQIIVIDSHSTDRTLEIVNAYHGEVYQYDSPIQSVLMQWALKNCTFKNDWVLRIDSDERWTPEGFAALSSIITQPEVNGVYVRRKLYFMGKWLRYGGMYVSHFLIVFRHRFAQMEDKLMDEHFIVEGKVVKSTIDVIEANYDRQENISLWTDKHNRYSTREAVEFLKNKHRLQKTDSLGNVLGSGVEQKRWFKDNFYYKTPLFIRPFLYFFYRYVVQLGFLDGTRGFIHAVLQGFWYRFLVDTKIYQITQLARKNGKSIRSILIDDFGVKM